MAKEITRLLHDLGRDDLYCVNPKRGFVDINGTFYPLYASIDDLPVDVDLAVYAAPAKFIPSFFSSLRKHIPRAVVLIPGIPSDLEYGAFVREIRAAIPPGVRVYREFVAIMEEAGIPVYDNIRSAARSLEAYVSWHMAHPR